MKKLLTLVAGLIISATSSAATLSFTESFGLATTNFDHSMSASQFDSALGTLNSVTFRFTDDIVQGFGAENTGAGAATVTPNLGAEFLFHKGGTTLLTTTLSGTGPSVVIPTFDGTVDFGGVSGHNFGNLTVSNTGMLVITGAALADFIGSATIGAVGYQVGATGSGSIFSSNGNGNLASFVTTRARYQAEVIYDFTPGQSNNVPVPGTLALMAVAMVGLGLKRRQVNAA
jgi:hypothetical protein